MTTKISDLYDIIKGYLEDVLPSSTLIPNVYFLERQSSQFLDSGYGFTFGPGSNTNSQQSCNVLLERDVNIIITKRIASLDADDEAFAEIEKEIFEEQYLLIQKMQTETDLNSSDIADCTFIADSGLEVLTTTDEVGEFYVLQSIFRCRYIEHLQP